MHNSNEIDEERVRGVQPEEATSPGPSQHVVACGAATVGEASTWRRQVTEEGATHARCFREYLHDKASMKAPPRAAGGGSVTGAEPPPLDRRPLAAVLLETGTRDHSRQLVLQLQATADSGHVHDATMWASAGEADRRARW